jgi:hypothetical protein
MMPNSKNDSHQIAMSFRMIQNDSHQNDSHQNDSHQNDSHQNDSSITHTRGLFRMTVSTIADNGMPLNITLIRKTLK